MKITYRNRFFIDLDRRLRTSRRALTEIVEVRIVAYLRGWHRVARAP